MKLFFSLILIIIFSSCASVIPFPDKQVNNFSCKNTNKKILFVLADLDILRDPSLKKRAMDISDPLHKDLGSLVKNREIIYSVIQKKINELNCFSEVKIKNISDESTDDARYDYKIQYQENSYTNIGSPLLSMITLTVVPYWTKSAVQMDFYKKNSQKKFEQIHTDIFDVESWAFILLAPLSVTQFFKKEKELSFGDSTNVKIIDYLFNKNLEKLLN